MESNHRKTITNLDTRQKHIIHLQSQLLRLDYQYAKIVKDLKQKYAKMAEEHISITDKQKQMRKENKKYQYMLQNKQRQNQQLLSKVQDTLMKHAFQQQVNRKLKEENQVLRNQIKYLEQNRSKIELKFTQICRKKDHYKDQCLRLQERNEILQRQLKKINNKNRQLQQFVQKQVMETSTKIHNIGMQLLMKNTFEQTKKQIYSQKSINYVLNDYQSPTDNNENNFNTKQTYSNEDTKIKIQIKNNCQQIVTDWQTDMKKLINCIHYGHSYLLVFDPMNLDRVQSRQIFKYIKKMQQKLQNQQSQYQNLRLTNQKILQQHRQTLQGFQQQIYKIAQQKSKRLTIETQIQTENTNSPDAHKALMQLSQMNTKLKVKGLMYTQCMEIMALRNVALQVMLRNAYSCAKYWKNTINKIKDQAPKKSVNKIKTAFCAVFFTQILIRKNKQTQKIKRDSNKKVPKTKIMLQVQRLDKQGVENVQLQKLKQSITINQDQVYSKVEDIINYYHFKLKNVIIQKSIDDSVYNF